jgi:spore coat protein CotH
MEKKAFRRTVAVVMTLALLAVAVMLLVPRNSAESGGTAMAYEALFDPDTVMTVDIQVEESAWETMLENATAETYIQCDIVVNGTTYYGVGIRPKGNTSLSQVASDQTTDRFSFKIQMDEYVKNQTLLGLDKFVLNNCISDATYLKEYLSYDMLRYIGVTTPLYCYASVTVNGEPWGLYLAVEAIEESFLARNYGSDTGSLYKPESMGGRGGGFMQEVLEGETQISGSGGSDLVYTDDSLTSYADILNNDVLGGTTSDYNRLIQAIKGLNQGENLSDYLDVDGALRYFAANTVLVNLDSYVSSLKHNYYLYEKDGILTILPWDYNLSFAGFQTGSASAAVNFPMDTPVSGVSLSERPLLARLLEEETYLAQYHAYIQEIVTGWMSTAEEKIDALDALIGDYVKNDATAFYTYEEYQTGLQALKTYIGLRAESLSGQLEGTIPTTSAGQQADASSLVDASGLVLSDMGSMGGGMGGGFGGDQRNQQQAPGEQEVTLPETENAAPGIDGQPSEEEGSAAEPGETTLPNGMEPPSGDSFPEGMTPPDGMEPPEEGEAPNGMMMPSDGTELPQGGGNALGGLSQEVMEQALAIIGDSTTLTEEQTQSLLALGLTQEQIDAVLSRAQKSGGMNMGKGGGAMTLPDGAAGQSGGRGGQSSQAASGDTAQWLVLGACLAVMVLGILFARGFRRRRD